MKYISFVFDLVICGTYARETNTLKRVLRGHMILKNEPRSKLSITLALKFVF